MAINKHQISISVSKRIQEHEFEPYEIILQESLTFDKQIKNPKKARRKVYNKLKVELDTLIEERFDEIDDETRSVED